MVTPKGPGRPATGRTTIAVTARLTLKEYATLCRRAERQGHKKSVYAAIILKKSLGYRPGQATRKREKKI